MNLTKKFKCFSCGKIIEVPRGIPKPMRCPYCGAPAQFIHRLDKGPPRGAGMRRGQVAPPQPPFPKIDESKCTGCGSCVKACPFGVLEIINGKAKIVHPERCRGCGLCVQACPNKAINL